MSGKALLVLVAAVVMVTVVGFGWGAGQPRLREGQLPELPPWLADLGTLFDASSPIDAEEIGGCELDGTKLRLDRPGARTTCQIGEGTARSRTLGLELESGRANVVARLAGEPAAEIEVKLPNERGERVGSLRVQQAGGTLSVLCLRAPCLVVLGRAPEES